MKDFNELYNQHFGKIFRFVYRLLGDSGKAEDIAQDTFLKLYNYLRENNNITHPKSWLYRVAANLSKNYLRRNNTYFSLISKNISTNDSVDQSLDESILENEQAKLFSNALKKLPARDQVLLQLYRDGLSYKEISQITKIKITSVGKLLSRAILKCAKQIKKDFL